jgi:hypothetical protein
MEASYGSCAAPRAPKTIFAGKHPTGALILPGSCSPRGPAKRAPGQASARRSFSRHIALQRAYDCERCVVVRIAGTDLRGAEFCVPCCQQSSSCVVASELVTATLAEYERRAEQFVGEPAMLEGLRTRLEQARVSATLFDAHRFRRHLEAAYEKALERYRVGRPPASFDIVASG